MTSVPNAHHRKCIQNAMLGGPGGENEAQLYTGEKIREECLEHNWIERMSDSPAGFRMYRATETGRAALQQPPPSKPARTKLKMFKPRIAVVDTRRLKPK